MPRRPPRLPRAILQSVVPGEVFEEIDGDLLELFEARVEEAGVWRARIRYWHDALTVYRHIRRSARDGVLANHDRRGVLEAAFMMTGNAFTELKHALKGLSRYPGYALAASLTLALGLAATVAIFTVANAVLLRPLPYPDSDRILSIRHHAPGLGMEDVASSPGLVLRYRDHARTLSTVAGYRMSDVNLTGHGEPTRLRALVATPDLLDVLATQPTLGRPFTPADAQENAPSVAILTHDLWQSAFGSDRAVVGRIIHVDGRAIEVIGVMAAGFDFPDTSTRLILPMHLDPQSGFGSLGLNSVARLAPEASLDAAQREISQLQQRIPEWFPGIDAELLASFGWGLTVEPLRDRVVAGIARTLWILLATVAFVLLIAGTNVANLFLIRAESRQRELAVRAALGAGRGRIAATFLAESLLLAGAGGAAGLVIAAWAIRLLVANAPAQLPRLHEIRMDPAVFAFAAALSLLTALVLALVPTATLGARSFTSLVRDSGRGNTASRVRQRLRRGLTVTQLAIAMVLLVGSGLMVRSAVRMSAIDPGFEPDGLLTVGVSPGAQPDRARGALFYYRLLEELRRLPGVESAGATSALPLAPGSLDGASFTLKSRPQSSEGLPPFTMYSAITEGYFETLGVPLIEGRLPERADTNQSRPVAWVNRAFAGQFLPGRAIGEVVEISERSLEIVGVVGDLKTFELRDEARPMVYVPVGHPLVGLHVMQTVMRTRGGPPPDVSALRSAVDAVNPSVPLTTVRSMDDILRDSMAQMAFTVTLLAVAAAAALALGMVGLYGVISYAVSQRTAEIGIRLALGASPAEVSALVLRQGLVVVAAGMAIGIAGAAAATQFMASLLYGVTARDPGTYAASAAVLLTVSAVATYLPARRAAAIDPAQSLRRQ
jgi:putative ABC transport system permease protein